MGCTSSKKDMHSPVSANYFSKITCHPMGCISLNKARHTLGYVKPAILASETMFTANEVEKLYELFKKLSSSVIKDGLIHKEELLFALFRNTRMNNLFADQIFDAFDIKHNGVIEFEEFVRSLSIFHPNAPMMSKVQFAFRLYDLKNTGYIGRHELREMVMALLNESDLTLSYDYVEMIVDKTFKEADMNEDGKIDLEDFKVFVDGHPLMMKIFTLPYLIDISTTFPSFVIRS